MKYHASLTIVDAIQYDGDAYRVNRWKASLGLPIHLSKEAPSYLTCNGERVAVGDYIVMSETQGFFTCKSEIFEKIYSPSDTPRFIRPCTVYDGGTPYLDFKGADDPSGPWVEITCPVMVGTLRERFKVSAGSGVSSIHVAREHS